MHIAVGLALPRDAASVPLARHTVTAALTRAGVAPDCVGDVEVALSEACTNAYRHAQDGDSFEVAITIRDDNLTIDVVDAGAGVGHRASAVSMPSPAADGGRGMALMAAFSDQVVYDSVTYVGGAVHLTKRLQWGENAPMAPAGERAATYVPQPRSPPD